MTNAATGIGQAIAIRFAQEGASVVVDYIGDPNTPNETENAITAAGGKSIAVAAAHPIGVGDALYRHAKKAGTVDTVPFGAFKRELLARSVFLMKIFSPTRIMNLTPGFASQEEKSGSIRRSGQCIFHRRIYPGWRGNIFATVIGSGACYGIFLTRCAGDKHCHRHSYSAWWGLAFWEAFYPSFGCSSEQS